MQIPFTVERIGNVDRTIVDFKNGTKADVYLGDLAKAQRTLAMACPLGSQACGVSVTKNELACDIAACPLNPNPSDTSGDREPRQPIKPTDQLSAALLQ